MLKSLRGVAMSPDMRRASAAYERALVQADAVNVKIRALTSTATDTLRDGLARTFDSAMAEAEAAFDQFKDAEEMAEASAPARRLIASVEGDGRVSVGREESTYRPDRPESFFRDIINSKQSPEAQERRQRNQREAAVEQRDVTTADPGAIGFVPPAYLGDAWAGLPRAARPFADAIGSQPLPQYGTQISVPKVQSGVTVASQTAEGNAVSETDIDSQSVQANLVTIAGLNDISLQAIERSYPGMDRVIFSDLQAAYDGELDSQLLSGTGTGKHAGIRGVSGAISVTYTAATPTAAALLPKVYDAIQQVASLRFRNPDVIVMHPRRAAWLASNLSSTQPLFQQGNLMMAAGEQAGGFATSFGGLKVVLDPNVTTVQGGGTNQDEIYVLFSDDLMLFEDKVQAVRFDDVLSDTLKVRLRLHAYSFFVAARQAKSIAIISGSGLSSPSFS